MTQQLQTKLVSNNATPKYFDKGEAFETSIKILQEKKDNNKEHCREKNIFHGFFRTTKIHSPAFPFLIDEKNGGFFNIDYVY